MKRKLIQQLNGKDSTVLQPASPTDSDSESFEFNIITTPTTSSLNPTKKPEIKRLCSPSVLDKVSEFLKVAESNKDTPEATQDLGIIIDCQDEDENKESDSSNESNDDDNDSENELSDSDSDSEMNSPCDDKQIIEMNIGLGVFDCIPISDQNETTGGGEEREVINEQTIKIPTTRSQDILDSKNLIEMME